jgi:hypothetical protein
MEELNPDKSDEAYAKQFRDANSLVRGIIKFCPRCMDGECFDECSYMYSETKKVNGFSGHCWAMMDKPCPLGMVELWVLPLMHRAANEDYSIRSKSIVKDGCYVNPCYEETPKTKEFAVEPDKATKIHEDILRADELAKAPRCECGQVREKGHKYCSGCALQKRREQDRLRKRKKRR